MKLSRSTIDIFRWCQMLQPGLFIRPGSSIRSITKNKSTLLDAKTAEEFPCNWGISQLSEVLPHLRESTEITFQPDNSVRLRNGSMVLDLVNEPEAMIFCPPNKPIGGDYDETFFLHADEAYELRKLVKRLGNQPGSKRLKGKSPPQPVIVFDSNNSERSLSIHYYGGGRHAVRDGDSNGTLVQKYTIAPTPDTILDRRWRIAFTARDLQLNEGSYQVSICRRGLARFAWMSGDVTIYVGIDNTLSRLDDTPFDSR
jgi:hypothetical protein